VLAYHSLSAKYTPLALLVINPCRCGFTSAFMHPTWCPNSPRKSSWSLQYKMVMSIPFYAMSV
jgi:hypothetical protein